MLPAIDVFAPLYIAIEGRTPWPRVLLITVPFMVALYLPFNNILHTPWPPWVQGDG